MNIFEYINNGHFSEYYKKTIEENGYNGFINLWTERWKYIFQEKYYFIEEYINDLSRREIINNVIRECEIENKEIFIEKINEIDKIFEVKTIELKKCITEYSGWANDKIFSKLFSRKMIKNEYNWFYFRIPPERIKDWGIAEIDLK